MTPIYHLLFDSSFMHWVTTELTGVFEADWIHAMIFIGALVDLASIPIVSTIGTVQIYRVIKDRFTTQVQAQQIH